MTHEEKRNFMLLVTDETENTASKACLYYVICFWHHLLQKELSIEEGTLMTSLKQ